MTLEPYFDHIRVHGMGITLQDPPADYPLIDQATAWRFWELAKAWLEAEND